MVYRDLGGKVIDCQHVNCDNVATVKVFDLNTPQSVYFCDEHVTVDDLPVTFDDLTSSRASDPIMLLAYEAQTDEMRLHAPEASRLYEDVRRGLGGKISDVLTLRVALIDNRAVVRGEWRGLSVILTRADDGAYLAQIASPSRPFSPAFEFSTRMGFAVQMAARAR